MTARLPVTPGRVLALIVGVPVALALIGNLGLTFVAYAAQASYPVRVSARVPGPVARLTLHGDGDLQLRPGTGDMLALHGTARYSLFRSAVRTRTSPEGVSVTSTCRFWEGICDFRYQASLPATARVADIAAGAGDVSVAGLPAVTQSVTLSDGSGNLTARGFPAALRTASVASGSGDITLGPLAATAVVRDGSGNITATSFARQATLFSGSGDMTVGRLAAAAAVRDGSGNVSVGSLAGPATLFTGSGDISVGSGSGPTLVIRDGSGNVDVGGLSSADVQVESGSGDITLTFRAAPRSVRISDDSGNVTIVLPAGGTRYHVTAHAASGNADVGVPTSPLSPNRIIVASSSGDIQITQR